MDHFTWLDLLILAVILSSLLLGTLRGMLSEILALLAWVAAFMVANLWADQAAALIGKAWPAATQSAPTFLPHLMGFVLVFVLVLVFFALARRLLTRLLRAIGLGPLDRLLGALFGVMRGLLIAWVGVLLCGLTDLPREPWWREAQLTPPLETAVIASKPWLPMALAQRIRYRAQQHV